MATLLPSGKFSSETITGAPLVGGKVYAYVPSTSTPKDTYTTSLENVQNPHPVILDSRGEATIYWSGSYDVILKDSNDVTVWGPERLVSSASQADLDGFIADLADTASASNGAALIGFMRAEAGARARTLRDKALEDVSVTDFGTDGRTSTAIRRALDAIGSIGGGRLILPPGADYDCSDCTGSTRIFIPTTTNRLLIHGPGAVLVGAGAGDGTIFESGAEAFSTGGTTNWEFDETYIHYDQHIDGLTFENCEYAMKLFNFLQGCVISCNHAAGAGVKTLLYAKRCFYAHVLANSVNNSHDPASPVDTDACYRFEEFNNSMLIMGNSAIRSAITKGTGYYFGVGTFAVNAVGNSAERCNKGYCIEGEVHGMDLSSNYLEGNTLDIAIEDANLKKGLVIDKNWLESAACLSATSWESGELGKANDYDAGGTVTLSDSLNACHVWLPRQSQGTVDARTATIIPAAWSVNASCILHAQNSLYLAASGPSGARAMHAEVMLGSTRMVPRHYTGNPALKRYYTADGGVPYAVISSNTTNPGPGNLVLDFDIFWDTEEPASVLYCFNIHESGVLTKKCAGLVAGTTDMPIFSSGGGLTVTPSVNSGKLRITLGGISVADVNGAAFIL